MAAEKVSRRSLSDDDHRRLIEEAIEEADLSAIATNGNGTRRVSVATTYAEALYEAALDADAVPQVAADVEAFADGGRQESADLEAALENPEIDSRAKSLVGAIATDAHPLVANFLQVLVERGRIAEFLEIADGVPGARRPRARPGSRSRPSPPSRCPTTCATGSSKSLQAKTNATVELTESVDPDVVGGLVLRVGEVVVDGSVRHRIEELRRELTARPRRRGRRPRLTPHAPDLSREDDRQR